MPNQRAWKKMIWGAGFDHVERVARFSMKATDGWAVRHAVFHARKGP